ncbi:hypothetical protein [Noviherbaspirillum sp. UKPF54]|uniref:hypothetical protein n=1 Tax=Noviherbaspirillum sp. UKPF54 TaxID=2601898 RepID=UPI0011B1286D|nr:hypothetical protein [Noviherbaspirillum sp. UKPF54]QDZ29513.1 hypothetical protein FAY22_17035 [Noviherbaspirillum sp. UKPF54]
MLVCSPTSSSLGQPNMSEKRSLQCRKTPLRVNVMPTEALSRIAWYCSSRWRSCAGSARLLVVMSEKMALPSSQGLSTVRQDAMNEMAASRRQAAQARYRTALLK